MISNIPAEITIGSFSIIGILTGYVWNSQDKKFKEIRDIQKSRPCNKIYSSIEVIKTDIAWIKKELKN